MSYTLNPTMENTFPNDGFFRLKTPLQCANGVFSADSLVKVIAIDFDETAHRIQYEIHSLLDDSLIVSDKFCFQGDIAKWNDMFVPIDASSYYVKLHTLHDEKVSNYMKREVLQTIAMPIMLLTAICAGSPVILYAMSSANESKQSVPSSAAVIICAIVLISVFVIFAALESHFTKKIHNAENALERCELDFFDTFAEKTNQKLIELFTGKTMKEE